ncbi:hypothetical protein WDW37_21260 [Bdellovibrionota bacterium FG-1]
MHVFPSLIVFALFAVMSPIAQANSNTNGQDCAPQAGTPMTPSPYLDARYFTDADELLAPPLGGENLNLGALPPHKRTFCQRTDASIIQDILNFPKQQTLSFKNPKGSFKTGLCWLHTRFQRFASYLANFRPDSPQPTRNQAKALIAQISHGQVTEIPGYADLDSFSNDFSDEVISELNSMGYRELLQNELSRRLGDSRSLAPADMAAVMDDIYGKVALFPHELFLRIRMQNQITPFQSHALLLLSIKPLQANNVHSSSMPWLRSKAGYELNFIDSNSPGEIITADYFYGETQLSYCYNEINDPIPTRHCAKAAVYPEFEEDILPIHRAIEEYCRH